MSKQELIQAAKEIREICCNAGKKIHGTIAKIVRFMPTRVSSLSARMDKKHIRPTYGPLSDWSVQNHENR